MDHWPSRQLLRRPPILPETVYCYLCLSLCVCTSVVPDSLLILLQLGIGT